MQRVNRKATIRPGRVGRTIVIAFIIAAVLTPPDVLSQASLALPLLALYEGSIIAVRIVEKKATSARASAGAPPAANPAE